MAHDKKRDKPHRHDHDHAHAPATSPATSPAAEHRAAGPSRVGIAIITVSDTRTTADDRSGDELARLFSDAGHAIASRAIVPDEAARIAAAIAAAESIADVRAIVLNGGTGIAKRDVTIEAVTPLLDRVLPGFGELFRSLSYAEIGSAALLSRAVAGIRGTRAIFALPGSTAAVRLAATKLIIPELPHVVRELDK